MLSHYLARKANEHRLFMAGRNPYDFGRRSTEFAELPVHYSVEEKIIRRVEMDGCVNGGVNGIVIDNYCHYIYVRTHLSIGFVKTPVTMRYWLNLESLGLEVNQRIGILWKFYDGYYLDIVSRAPWVKMDFDDNPIGILYIRLLLGVEFVMDDDEDQRLITVTNTKYEVDEWASSDWVKRKIAAVASKYHLDFEMFYKDHPNGKDLIYDKKFETILLNALYGDYYHDHYDGYLRNINELSIVPLYIERLVKGDEEMLKDLKTLLREPIEFYNKLQAKSDCEVPPIDTIKDKHLNTINFEEVQITPKRIQEAENQIKIYEEQLNDEEDEYHGLKEDN